MSDVAEVLDEDATYPLGDSKPPHLKGVKVRALPCGAFRPPRKGEWFLSGSLVTAYQAAHDMSTPYRLAVLVEVEEVVTFRPKRFVSDYPSHT